MRLILYSVSVVPGDSLAVLLVLDGLAYYVVAVSSQLTDPCGQLGDAQLAEGFHRGDAAFPGNVVNDPLFLCVAHRCLSFLRTEDLRCPGLPLQTCPCHRPCS